MKKFRTRGAYIHHTQISSILDKDPLFQVNIKALCQQRPDAHTFSMVRNHLVRSAVARFRRTKNEMALARAGVANPHI